MKKIFEGASIVSAIFFILTTACFFMFNVNTQKNKSKMEKHTERKIEKERKKQQTEKENLINRSHYEIEKIKKLKEQESHNAIDEIIKRATKNQKELENQLLEEKKRSLPENSRVEYNRSKGKYEIIHSYPQDPSPRP